MNERRDVAGTEGDTPYTSIYTTNGQRIGHTPVALRHAWHSRRIAVLSIYARELDFIQSRVTHPDEHPEKGVHQTS